MMTIHYPPEARARCAEHWDKVRAGLRPASTVDHVYGTMAENTIAAHRYNARLLSAAAAREMAKAEELAAAEGHGGG